MSEFKSKIAGIPCLVHIDYYQPYEEDFYDRDYGWSPGSDEEVEFSILDWKGYPAAWLEKKMTSKDDERIYNEALDYVNDR